MKGKTLAQFSAEHLSAAEEHRLRRENKDLRRQLDLALAARDIDQRYEDFILDCLAHKARPPKWAMRSVKDGARMHQVMPVTNFSDWHLDENVRPEEVQNKNKYNREIALARIKQYFGNVIKICTSYVKGYEYPGIEVVMAGDIFSGTIHDELKETNVDKILGSVVYWLDPMIAGLRLLADAFGQVHVVVVVGNHGRLTKKPIAKMRARDNFDWLFAHLLRRELDRMGEKRISWHIDESHKAIFSVFDTKIIATHGDECKGGSGIAGMLSPQLIAFSRMKKVYDFDIWMCGHWHTRGAYRNIRVNGSGVGYNEFAMIRNFDFQLPQQDLFFIAPKRGVIADWPVFCDYGVPAEALA